MTFRFCDGFDGYTAASQFTSKWSSANGAAFGASAGRFGGGAIYNSGSASGLNFSKALSIPSGAKTRVGFSLKYSAGAAPSSLSGGYYVFGVNSQGAMTLNQAGQLIVVTLASNTAVLTSTTTVNDGNWHWVELEYFLNGASGSAQLWIDGVSQGSFSGSLGSSAVAVNSVTFGLGYVFTGTGWIDDVVVWDDQGSTFNTVPLGPRRISTLVPNADGDLTQFTPKTGTSHYAMVNGGFGSSNYVSDSSTGNVDLYKFPVLSYSPTSINAVVGNFYGQNTGSGTTSLIAKLKTSGSTLSGTTQTLSVGVNSLYQALFVTDAGGSAWSASAVNAMQLGMGD